jgi:hypothetical protein
MVDKYRFPLASLCFMAGDGICKFNLHCIEESIISYSLHPLLPGTEFRIIFNGISAVGNSEVLTAHG